MAHVLRNLPKLAEQAATTGTENPRRIGALETVVKSAATQTADNTVVTASGSQDVRGPALGVPRRAVMGRVPVPHSDALPATRFHPAAARRGKGGTEAHPGGTRSALPAPAPQPAC
jgi:hypothetical protein